ncbi:tripartite tricarboxylate transporter substrate-binding protein [Larsenimonas salina]|uniref:tripartite tricarboxylate transporter substrate-binding protein n=1 Tax=Larsenimonas salina TaxID=1295565 RepID=UPI002072B7EE|nr:tripartite tricarboxylate transporter substrate-binding protein [Larsenimonas salina]MCM5704233.1 tripartite tricarboxylate transporter substrate-binding protein [Larsenimonas salina]
MQSLNARPNGLPDVPTLKEKGYDINISNWRGVAAPQGLDDDVRSRWVAALKQASEDPAFQKRIEQLGIDVDFRSGPEFQDYVESLSSRLIPVAQAVASENR